jgi:hypothetical protein
MELRLMEKWKDYAEACVDNLAKLDPRLAKTPAERDEIRKAFYGGACCIFHIMNTDMMDEKKSEREREIVLDDLAREIQLYMQELQSDLRRLLQ